MYIYKCLFHNIPGLYCLNKIPDTEITMEGCSRFSDFMSRNIHNFTLCGQTGIYTQGNLFQILSNQTEIRLYLRCTD